MLPLNHYLQIGSEFLTAYGLALGAGFILVGSAIYLMLQKDPGEGKMKKEEYILSKRQQRQAENNVIADEVEDMLLKLFSKGTLSQERYQYWHMRFGTQIGLKDLLPPKLTPAQVKKAAQTRLKHPTLYKPVNIPTPKKARYKNKLDEALHNL